MIRVDGLTLDVTDARSTLVIGHELLDDEVRMTFHHVAIQQDSPAGTFVVRVVGHSTETHVFENPTCMLTLMCLKNLFNRAGCFLQECQVRNYAAMVGQKLDDRAARAAREERRLRTSDIERLMEAVDMARSEIVPCLIGASGIGKTEGIESFARKHGRKVVHLIASQVLPTEVSGMTMPNQETHAMDVFDHSRISHMQDGDILFLDELLKGQQQVLSACLTMVQERRLMSGTPLPDVIIVAAANPLASPKMLPLEIRQRFLFVEVEFDCNSWCDYMCERGVPRPGLIVDRLVTRHEGSDWNTLTPRTATKLMLWLRDVMGTDSDYMVRSVIRSTFGEDVLNLMWRTLQHDDHVIKTGSPIEQVTKRIYELVDELPHTYDIEEISRRVELLTELSEASNTGTCSNVADLLDRIGKLSGGTEILKALRKEIITMPDI